MNIPTRELGKTGIAVPAVSFGCYGLGIPEVDDRQAITAVEAALENGIHYFDTSPMYHESERRLGTALKGVPRSAYVVSTKVGSHPLRRGDYSRDAVMWSVENSMKLLGTDRLDLVHVHDPDWLREDGLATILCKGGAFDALEELKRQGVIKAIGLAQKSFQLHEEAILSGRIDALLTFNNYHPLDTSAAERIMPLAKEHGVAVINASVMGHGLLCGKDPEEIVRSKHHIPPIELKKLIGPAGKFYRWCREREVSMISILFQFSMRQSMIDCTLMGAKTVEELQQNLKAIATPLPEEIWAELSNFMNQLQED